MEFFLNNLEWEIPTIVAIIAGMVIPFILKKKQNNKLLNQNITNSENVSAVQIDTINISNKNLSIEDVKQISELVFKNNFPALQEIAKNEAIRTAGLLNEKLIKKVSNELTEKEINKFKDPDVQYALYEAEKGAARRDSEDLRENLSDLIIARIKNDDDDLKKLIYNEAISTINKITTNQLKILAIVLALRYLNFPFIRDWESFNIHFNMHIKPLLDFDESEINFTHLDYSSCASIIPQGKYILIDRLKNTYTFLFQNPIDNPEIKEMKNILIDKKIFPQIFKYNIKIKKYEFNCRNFDNLIKILGKNKIWRDIQNEIMGLYESIIKSDSEIRKEIEERTDLGEKILFRWDHSKINVINLKSVGVILGALYLEKISNVGMDINNLIYN